MTRVKWDYHDVGTCERREFRLIAAAAGGTTLIRRVHYTDGTWSTWATCGKFDSKEVAKQTAEVY